MGHLVAENRSNEYTHEQPLYLRIDGQNTLIGASSAFLEHGQSGDIVIHFVPTESGMQTVKVTRHSNGEETVWSEEISIEPSDEQILNGNIDIEGVKNGTIESTSIHAMVTIHNDGENIYSDIIRFRLYPYNNDGVLDDWYSYTETGKELYLEPGQTKIVDFLFEGLDAQRSYHLTAGYFDSRSWRSVETDFVTVKTGVILFPAELRTTMKALNADENGFIKNNEIHLQVDITNVGNYDYNDRIDIMLWDCTDGEQKWMPQSQNLTMSIPVGETQTIEHNIVGLEYGHRYQIGIYFYSENIWTFGTSQLFTIEESSGIYVPVMQKEESQECYTINGLRKISCRGRGVHIHRMSNGTFQKRLITK